MNLWTNLPPPPKKTHTYTLQTAVIWAICCGMNVQWNHYPGDIMIIMFGGGGILDLIWSMVTSQKTQHTVAAYVFMCSELEHRQKVNVKWSWFQKSFSVWDPRQMFGIELRDPL